MKTDKELNSLSPEIFKKLSEVTNARISGSISVRDALIQMRDICSEYLTEDIKMSDTYKECTECGKLKMIGVICKGTNGFCNLSYPFVKTKIKS